jgi:hypothetical protein
VPIFIILWSLSNFAGPVILGRLFDTIGRKPMISFSYLGSAVVAVVLALVFVGAGGRRVAVPHHPRRLLLPRLLGRQRRLPHGQRDLPDGDPGAGDRVLLRRSAPPPEASPVRCSSAA